MAAIERSKQAQRLGDAISARMAQADGKAWKAFVKGIKGGR